MLFVRADAKYPSAVPRLPHRLYFMLTPKAVVLTNIKG